MTCRAALGGLLLLIGAVAQAAVVDSKSSDLRFTEPNFDFGCVGVDFKVLHTFKLVNDGQVPIHIDTVTGHCDCTEVRFLDSLLAPGDTSEILIIFNTANFYGPVEKTIGVRAKAAKNSSFEVAYSATVGQWLMKLEPRPVSVFFLPSQKVRKAEIFNHALDKVSVNDIYLDDDIVEIKRVKGEAGKGEGLEFEITPRATLPPGTHISNYTLDLNLHQSEHPLRITIPVKVVKY